MQPNSNHSDKPVGKKPIAYHGTWKSSMYGSWIASGSGEALVDFKKQIVSIKLKYGGFYQHGTVKEWSIPFHENKAEITNIPSYGFTREGKRDTTQSIEMTTNVFTDNEIIGIYQSNEPVDRGTFEFKRFDQATDQKPALCSVM